MVLAVPSLQIALPRPERTHFELRCPIGTGTSGRLQLEHAMRVALSIEPPLLTSRLLQVEFAGGQAVVRFEQGEGTLQQRLLLGARRSKLLPLPFFWSARLIAHAASGLAAHVRRESASLGQLCPLAVMTVNGEPRLNAAVLEPPGASEPCGLSLARTLATCLGVPHRSQPLRAVRPILPAAVVDFVDDSKARALAGDGWFAETAHLLAQLSSLQGANGHFVPSAQQTALSRDELLRYQLGLLPWLLELDGALAVDAFFAERCVRWPAESEQFRSAFLGWRRQRILPPVGCHDDPESAKLGQERRRAETCARIAQARFELKRGQATAGLRLAIDCAIVDPGAPEVWLALAEIRGPSKPGSQALCLAEAICAARGDESVLAIVQQRLGLADEPALARFFHQHGDHVLARWLEAGASPSAAARSIN